MIGSKPLESVLGVAIDNRDHEAVRANMRAAADIGLSLLFIWPDSKVPADLRTARQKNAEDRAAQQEAKDAGRRDWATVKSPSGLALATSDKAVLDRYLKAYIQQFSTWRTVDDGANEIVMWTKKAADAGEIYMAEPAAVNLAVEVGGSGIVVIDCDTAAQMRRWFEVNELDPDTEAIAPTVLTPGHFGADADPDDKSTWAHSDGGHFYFTVPDKYLPVLPRHIGAMTWGGDDGFAVLWDRRYVLIPPSTRPEGAYEQLGHVYDLPDWLAEAIIEQGKKRVNRAALAADDEANNPGLSNAVDAWAEGVSWQSILEPLGWTPAPRADSCGCAVWTAPGVHASPKSATAHDTGCTAGRYTERNAPLHIWTDNPAEPFDQWIADKGTSTISKLQAVALINYAGNVGKAMDDMGVTPDLSVEPGLDVKGPTADLDTNNPGDFELPQPTADEPIIDHADDGTLHNIGETAPPPDQNDDDALWCRVCETTDGLFVPDPENDEILWHAIDADDAAETGGHRADGTPTDPQTSDPLSVDKRAIDPSDFGGTPDASPYPDEVENSDPDVFDSQHTGVPRIAPFSHWRDMPPPEYIIDGLIEHGGLSCLIGSPGIGKSTVALDMAAHIATGKRWQGRQTLKTRVLYLPGEGLSGAVQRLRAWEAAHGVSLDRDLLLGDSIILVSAQNEAWGELAAYIIRQQIGLIIFDTFARMSSGLEENSATDVGKAVRRCDIMRKHTNAGVCIVHHTAKGAPDVARGSSALNGALDSEILVRPATWDDSELRDDNGRIEGKPIEIWTTKQKNSEQLEHPIPLLMRDLNAVMDFDYDNGPGIIKAPVIVGPNGKIDPMQGEVVHARPPAEPIVETAIRIRQFLDRLPEQGATRTEIVLAVKPDAYARMRADAAVYWKQRIGEAVDKGLRYQLFETLTGTPSGARYIPGQSPNSPEQARVLAAAEVNDQD